MKKINSQQVWDKVWVDEGLIREADLVVSTEAVTIRWQRIRQHLIKQKGSLKGLQVLELGSGMGTYAALLAKEGAFVTLLDYSSAALHEAKQFFRAQRLKANYLQADILHLSAKATQKKFDITISIGLAEHFVDQNRRQVIKAHLDFLKKGGLAVIAVPNSWNPPYRVYKWVAEALGKWKFGLEVPYSRTELRSWAKILKAEYIDIVGDNFYSSIKFVLPAHFLRRWFRVDFPRHLGEIRTEKGTPLDSFLGYSLTLIMKKTTFDY